MNFLPTLQAPVRGQPLLLYLASNSQAIGALLAQEDDDENEQPIYYVSRTLKDVETRYPKIEKACLVVIYASQRLKRYFAAQQILLVTKSHPIRALLHQPLLTKRIAQWLVLLSQYDISIRTLRAVKSQAIADLLAQFPGSEECSLSEEIPREVAVIELPGKRWTMRFDGSATTTLNGLGIVLSCEDGDTLPLSFKLGFYYSNNAIEYEAYLTGLTIAIAIEVKHMRVLGDSNLVVSQWVEAIPLKKATGAAVANFIQEHIITRFGISRRLISDNGIPFINKDMKSLTEANCIKHGRSTPYYPQGNGQAEATNRVILKILKKMKHEYGGKWSDHLTDVLWACRSSVKTATGFSPFSLVYGTEAISLKELVIPTPRVVLEENQEDTEDTSNEKRLADLEGVEEERELARKRSQGTSNEWLGHTHKRYA
ncbi:uncharacterized protein LOC142634639 [Castanea sativa]|uniref:uncharacterized protein LOC142634639 n=1 Tax=Castanea sativa TaxID=21020 RepID=UPI003F653948